MTWYSVVVCECVCVNDDCIQPMIVNKNVSVYARPLVMSTSCYSQRLFQWLMLLLADD